MRAVACAHSASAQYSPPGNFINAEALDPKSNRTFKVHTSLVPRPLKGDNVIRDRRLTHEIKTTKF